MSLGAMAFFTWILAAAIVWPGAARAQVTASSDDIQGVLELFTSQGCGTCPPADGVLADYARKDGMIALSYHVDYWDYIGWEDNLGSRRNTERQKAYAKSLGIAGMYTPQVVVNGEAEVLGSDRTAIRAALEKSAMEPLSVRPSIQMSTRGEMLDVKADLKTRPQGEGPPVLLLVTYTEQTRTLVQRGDNRDKELVDTHAVKDWRVMGMVTTIPYKVDLPIALLQDPNGAKTGCVALIQAISEGGAPGRILAAASLTLPQSN